MEVYSEKNQTFIEAFSYPVNNINDYRGFIDCDDDGGCQGPGDYNAALNLNLEANETVYIKVMGCDQTISGDYTFCASSMYRSIALNTAYAGSIESENEEWFAFTAIESDTYLFYTGLDIDADTYGEIYNGYLPLDEFAELLAFNDDAFNSEDDQSNFNFGIEYDLFAGDIVYIKVTGYENFYWEMSYDFQIEKVG